MIAVVALIIIQIFVKKDGKMAVVTVNGQVYATLDLSKDTELVIHGAWSRPERRGRNKRTEN